MILLAGVLDLAGHTPAFRTNHPHAIKSADGKGRLEIFYQNQLCSDEGPKIAPMNCSSSRLNFTIT